MVYFVSPCFTFIFLLSHHSSQHFQTHTLSSVFQELYCMFNMSASSSIGMNYDCAIIVLKAMCFQEH